MIGSHPEGDEVVTAAGAVFGRCVAALALGVIAVCIINLSVENSFSL
jgi:hypothetical protein